MVYCFPFGLFKRTYAVLTGPWVWEWWVRTKRLRGKKHLVMQVNMPEGTDASKFKKRNVKFHSWVVSYIQRRRSTKLLYKKYGYFLHRVTYWRLIPRALILVLISFKKINDYGTVPCANYQALIQITYCLHQYFLASYCFIGPSHPLLIIWGKWRLQPVLHRREP